jgi:hypothetical protein
MSVHLSFLDHASPQVLARLAPTVGSEAAGCAAVTAVFSHLAQTVVDFLLVGRCGAGRTGLVVRGWSYGVVRGMTC